MKDKDTRKFLQDIARYCPLAFQQFFGRKYLLPHYRQSDYGNQDFEALISFDRVIQFATALFNPRDEVQRAALGTTLASLHFKRPTLFLERELGEAFLRAKLPEEFTTGEINWRWGAFRIWLPLGLIGIERADGIRSLTCFDITQIGPTTQKVYCPPELARELDSYAARLVQRPNRRLLETINFLYKEDGICVSAPLNKPENPDSNQTLYGLTKPWGKINLGGLHAIRGDLKSPYGKDDRDDQLLNRLEHLVMQVLLFLGAVPLEYETHSRMIRPARAEGKNLHPGLFDARFVGQSQLRPYKPGVPRPAMVGAGVKGQHARAKPCWVSGHWKRVLFGPGRKNNRLSWIMTYHRGDDPLLAEKGL